jgi:hypothetical protein
MITKTVLNKEDTKLVSRILSDYWCLKTGSTSLNSDGSGNINDLEILDKLSFIKEIIQEPDEENRN